MLRLFGGTRSNFVLRVPQLSNGFFTKTPSAEEPRFRKVLKKLGWTETSRSVLLASGARMYIKVADEVNYLRFFEQCELEDTLSSWFTVVELHVWLLSSRLMSEGDEGKIVRNAMVKAMWDDVDHKSKRLEGALSSARKEQVQELNQIFVTSLFNYDEGILGNDVTLAGALWRRFLKGSQDSLEDQEVLLKKSIALRMLVCYVRSNYYELYKIDKYQLVRKLNFTWKQFTEEALIKALSSS